MDSTFLPKWHILYSLAIHLQIVAFLSVDLTINVMKISRQQRQFHDPNKHFLAGGGVEESCPFGEGFHFLPPLPSSKNALHLVDDSFRKSIPCLETAKNTLCKKCLWLPLFSHMLGIIMGAKKEKKTQANQSHCFQIKEVSCQFSCLSRYNRALETCYVIS